MGGNQDRARITASALFDAVIERLRRQPPSARPLLLLYGESLGSFGSEWVFADLAEVRTHADGVLWVGPTRANHLWRRFTAARDGASPEWRPVYQDGRTVRFGADGEELAHPSGRWTTPRVAYLQHPSDPVTWWTPDLLFNRPEWLRDPRPPGISHRTPYVPFVTFVQTTIDTALGGNAPMGHGHMYGVEHASAWAHIAPPRDWAPDDTARLHASSSRSPADGVHAATHDDPRAGRRRAADVRPVRAGDPDGRRHPSRTSEPSSPQDHPRPSWAPTGPGRPFTSSGRSPRCWSADRGWSRWCIVPNGWGRRTT